MQLIDLKLKLEVSLLHLVRVVYDEWNGTKLLLVCYSDTFNFARLWFFFFLTLNVSTFGMTSNLEARLAGWLYACIGWQPLKANVVELVLSFPIFTQSTVDLALLVILAFPYFGWRCLAIHDWVLINVAPVDLLNWLCLVYISEVTVDIFHRELPAILKA